MTYLTEEELHARRLEKVSGWLDWRDDVAEQYAEIVLSRPSELASEAGADPDPKLRPCEHRQEWLRGRLCLACDNTGLRRATDKEREDGLAYDPYLIDPPQRDSSYNVTRDESTSAIRSRDMEQLNAAIATLQRNARIRAGAETIETPTMRLVRLVERTRHDHPMLRRLERALELLRKHRLELYYAALAREDEGLEALLVLLPGRMRSTARA